MIESQKYSIESDYVQTYLNKFIIQTLFFKNQAIINDAFVFSRCVNMVPLANNLANCSSRRDRVENFLNENEETVKPFREAAEKCTSELQFAFSINRNLETDNNLKFSEKNFFNYKRNKAEKELKACIDSHLH